MSKRKNMGRGVERGGGGGGGGRREVVQSLFPAFMFSIIHVCILSFFPLLLPSLCFAIFLLPFFFLSLSHFYFCDLSSRF